LISSFQVNVSRLKYVIQARSAPIYLEVRSFSGTASALAPATAAFEMSLLMRKTSVVMLLPPKVSLTIASASSLERDGGLGGVEDGCDMTIGGSNFLYCCRRMRERQAIAHFNKALEWNPELNFDPATKAKQFAANR